MLANSARRPRRLTLEKLELRQLLDAQPLEAAGPELTELDFAEFSAVATDFARTNGQVRASNNHHPLDINQDSLINGRDLLALVHEVRRTGWGTLPELKERRAIFDVNRDGSLSPLDLLLVVRHFDHVTQTNRLDRAVDVATYHDAQLLAMTASQELKPSSPLVDRIYRDLMVIRQSFPDVAAVHHTPFTVPSLLLVTLTDEALAEFRLGNYDGLDELNQRYGPVSVRLQEISRELGAAWVVLEFENVYHPGRLAELYKQADGVSSVSLDHYIRQNDVIHLVNRDEWQSLSDPGVTAQYYFVHQTMSCSFGCHGNQAWGFSVTNGVPLVSWPTKGIGYGFRKTPYQTFF